VMELAHPRFLVLLPLLVLLLWIGGRTSLAGLSPRRYRICFLARTVMLSLLVLALAGVRLLLPSRELAVFFDVDASNSISPGAQKQACSFVRAALDAKHRGDTAGIVGFAREPAVWEAEADASFAGKPWPAAAHPTATDLGQALDFTSGCWWSPVRVHVWPRA